MKFETTITNKEGVQPSEKMELAIVPSLEETFTNEVHGKEVLLCCLVDTSASMAANNNIGQLSEGLATLKTQLMADEMTRYSVKIALIAYNGQGVTPIFEDISPDEFSPPQLIAKGQTPMGEAYRIALEGIEKWKQNRSDRKIAYWRPWMVNFTDGQPTDEWRDVAKSITKAENEKEVVSWIVATEGANFQVLEELSTNRPVIKLNNADYKGIFEWLSVGMSTVSRSDEEGKKPLEHPAKYADASTNY